MNSIEMSCEDEPLEKSVWCRGDKCKVRWSGDGEVYSASVKKIIRTSGRPSKALVTFDGFNSEDDEEVKLEQLMTYHSKKKEQRRRPDTPTVDSGRGASILSFMKDDEDERLRRKFELRELEEELEEPDPRPSRQSWKTTTKYLVNDHDHSAATSALRKKSSTQKPKPGKLPFRGPKTPTDSSSRSACADDSLPKNEPKRTPVALRAVSPLVFTDSESEEDKPAKRGAAHNGFDDEELEKPRLSHLAHSPKVPLVLSAEGEEPQISVPATINQYLWDYQRDGVRFLYRHHHQCTGAILGDDMGLGKTVQVIAFLSALLRKTGTKADVLKQRPKFIRRMESEDYEEEEEHGPKKVYLIIGPASVLYNWIDELETWGHFNVGKYHKHHKDQTLADLRKDKLDVVVTTFETCRDNVDVLNRFEWDAVIADEAHKIKGMKAEMTQSLKRLKCKRRFGLTGTALQNDMKELWCILDWANPGCLGTVYNFEQKFEKVILEGQKQGATKKQLAQCRKAAEKFAELRTKWFIRRTKALIADQLPKKEEQVVYCRPTSFQIDVYKAILGHPHIQVIVTRNDPCPCKSGKTRGKCCFKKADDGRTVNQLLFSYLQLLLKTANHVALLMPQYTTNENQRRQAEDICEIAFAQHPQFREQTRVAAFRTLSDPKYCGKMKIMAGLLKVFKKEKCKVLLFSLSTQLLDIIEHFVVTTGYEYRRLDGKTPNVKRVQLVREFNHDPGIFLFLASTRAGGVGLNLTGANVVLIYDPNWNPTHDLQAQDRAYRVGQGRDVRVFRLIAMGTVEETIYLRQVYKQQIDSVMVSDDNAKRLFHHEEIFGLDNLFKLRTSEKCLTSDIIQRNAKIETSLKGFTVTKYIPPTVDDKGKDEPKATAKRKSRAQLGDSQDVDFLCNEEKTSSEEDGEEEEIYGKGDSMYGEDEPNYSKSDDGATTDASDIPVKLKPHREMKKAVKSQAIILDSDSDSEADIICGQQELAEKQRRKKESQRASCKGAAQCLECVRPSAGTSTEQKPHTCGKTTKDLKLKNTRISQKKGRTREVSSSEDDIQWSRQQSTVSEPTATLACVSDVFDQYGVVHQHENRKLIGASRAEDHMTRCAIQDVYELHQYSQAPAAYCAPLSESSAESDDLGANACTKEQKKTETPATKKRRATPKKDDTSHRRSMVIDNTKVLIGQTPVGIRRHQFKEIAAKLKAKDTLDLAQRVLKSSPADLQDLLKQFYVDKDSRLKDIFVDEQKVGKDENIRKRGPKKTNPRKQQRGEQKSRQQKEQQRRQAARKRGCLYSSEDEEKQETKAQQRHQISVSEDEEREKGGKSSGSERESVSNTAQGLLDEMLNFGGGEKSKSAPKTPKRANRFVRLKCGDKLQQLEKANISEASHTSTRMIDNLFDDSDEDRQRRLPKTPKKTLRETEIQLISRTQHITARTQSILDDLYDDTNTRRKPAPKRRIRAPVIEQNKSASSDSDNLLSSSPTKCAKLTRKPVEMAVRRMSPHHQNHRTGHDEDLFQAMSPVKREDDGRKQETAADSGMVGENSLDAFSRECKMNARPVVNATLDDSLFDSDDEYFSHKPGKRHTTKSRARDLDW